MAEAGHERYVAHSPESAIHHILLTIFTELNIVPSIVSEANEDQAILSLVKAGVGCAIMTDSLNIRKFKNIVFIPIEHPYERKVCMAVMKNQEKSEIVKHYRVDKIKHLNIEKAKRNGESIFQNFDMEKFSAGTFGMFGGKETPVRMEFENRFVGVVLDRFGQDVMLIPRDEKHFSMQTHISVSPKFFGWLASLGTGAVIISPENVRREYISFMKNTLMNYGEE